MKTSALNYKTPKWKRKNREFYYYLGERIKALRVRAGYSRYDTFAYDADIPRALYGKYEQGVNLTFYSFLRILNFHNISVNEFFSEGFETYQSDLKNYYR